MKNQVTKSIVQAVPLIMILGATVTLGSLSSVSYAAGQSARKPATSAAPLTAELALKDLEGARARMTKLGESFVKDGQELEPDTAKTGAGKKRGKDGKKKGSTKVSDVLLAVAERCDPSKVPMIKAQNKGGKEIGMKFLESFGGLETLTTFSEEEKTDKCAMARRLDDLKKDAKTLETILSHRKARAPLIHKLQSGLNDIDQGLGKFRQLNQFTESFGPFSPIISGLVKPMVCDGYNPEPSLRWARGKIAKFYGDVMGFTSGVKALHKRTKRLIVALKKSQTSCQASAAPTPAEPPIAAAPAEPPSVTAPAPSPRGQSSVGPAPAPAAPSPPAVERQNPVVRPEPPSVPATPSGNPQWYQYNPDEPAIGV